MKRKVKSHPDAQARMAMLSRLKQRDARQPKAEVQTDTETVAAESSTKAKKPPK